MNRGFVGEERARIRMAEIMIFSLAPLVKRMGFGKGGCVIIAPTYFNRYPLFVKMSRFLNIKQATKREIKRREETGEG